jgi:hypothetical protein
MYAVRGPDLLNVNLYLPGVDAELGIARDGHFAMELRAHADPYPED